LTKHDFTLLEDGVPQEISNFSFVDLPVETPASPPARTAPPEPDIITNADEGRMYVMLINIVPRQDAGPTRLVARRFVEEAFGSNDQMAVIHVLDSMTKAQGFTKSRSLLLAAIDRVDQPPDVGDPVRVSFQVLEEVSERLGRISGRRKAVLWFNPPQFFQPDDKPGAMQKGGTGRWFAQRDALRAATRNNVAIYPITPAMGTALGLESLKGLGALRAMAEETGGDAIINTNNFSPAFQRVVRDNSTYYLLGYEPAVEHRDGRFHSITIRVNRPGLAVRARRGYYAPEPDAEAKPDTSVVDGLSPDTTGAVRMPSSVAGLGIDLFAAPFKGAGGNGSVLLGAELRGADLALGANETIEIAYQGTTAEGKVTPGEFKVFTLDFTPESRVAIEQTGIRFIDWLDLPQGRHQVRFAVHQPNGKTGSVVADVEIPDYGAPLVMSGVVMGSQETASERTFLSDPRLKTLLSSDPTTARRFSRRDAISAFAEVYWDPRSRSLAEDFEVSASLTTADGANAHRPTVSAIPGEPGRMGYVMRIRAADLTPGDYVLTLEASSGRRQATRQVPFAVVED
jgi:VWFA-related protein